MKTYEEIRDQMIVAVSDAGHMDALVASLTTVSAVFYAILRENGMDQDKATRYGKRLAKRVLEAIEAESMEAAKEMGWFEDDE